MTATENAYQELLSAVASCNTVADVENIVKQILGIDEKHLFFDQIVDKICQRADISTNGLVDAQEVVVEYLQDLENKGVIRAFDETHMDFDDMAIQLIERYTNIGKLPMARFKQMMLKFGFVIGPAFKSTRILTNKIDVCME